MVPIEVAQHFDLSTRQIRELQSTGVPSKGATLDEARLAYIRPGCGSRPPACRDKWIRLGQRTGTIGKAASG